MLRTLAIADSEIDADVDAVSRLFAGHRSRDVLDYLRYQSQSPLQVPFYFLHLLQQGNTERNAGPTAKPTAEDVDLAYRAILQRPPEDEAVVSLHIDACADTDTLIAALLSSQEVIERMPQLHARAFPSGRRLWHVHIPKTAGSSFFDAAVASGWGFVNTNMLSGALGDPQLVAESIRLSPEPTGPTIISGHWSFSQYFDCIGPFDQVVAFVRHPLDHCISEFNYAVDVFHGRTNVHAADPQPMLDRGLDPTSFQRSLEQGYFLGNVQCGYLSSDGTCATALKNLTSCRAELLPSAAASEAIARYFPTAGRRRVNVSNKHVTKGDVEPAVREKILLMSSQDFLLNEIAETRYHAG